jgi:hypothetical protein
MNNLLVVVIIAILIFIFAVINIVGHTPEPRFLKITGAYASVTNITPHNCTAVDGLVSQLDSAGYPSETICAKGNTLISVTVTIDPITGKILENGVE